MASDGGKGMWQSDEAWCCNMNLRLANKTHMTPTKHDIPSTHIDSHSNLTACQDSIHVEHGASKTPTAGLGSAAVEQEQHVRWAKGVRGDESL